MTSGVMIFAGSVGVSATKSPSASVYMESKWFVASSVGVGVGTSIGAFWFASA